MNNVPPRLADFARRLFEHEAEGHERTQDFVDAMERACRALHAQLAPLVSAPGVAALLARAVTLAGREFPFLVAAGELITPTCSVDGLRQAVDGHAPAEAADALVAILANFLWLLVTFIGENLGVRKVQEVWPAVPFTPPSAPSEKAEP
jgi:hypothetical protein